MLSGDVKLSVSIFRGHKKKLLSLCVNNSPYAIAIIISSQKK